MTPFESSPTPDEEESLSSQDALEALVAQCLERVDRDGLQALSEMCLANPGQAEALRRRFRILGEARLVGAGDKVPPLPVTPGDTHTFGHYQLLRELGRGGMGVVYLAHDTHLRRDVALKLLPAHVGRTERESERFQRELRALASLKHPGIVQVYDGGMIDGVAYFTMEHVEGRSLADATRQLRRRGLSASKLGMREFASAMFADPRPLPESDDHATGVAPDVGGVAIPVEWGGPHVEVVARITIEVALALQHAHERGVLHRDVKPSNILMDSSGHVRLIDFGLARIDAEPEFTRPGDFLGTPIYVAPEQIVGTRATVDARTDVYSLGVTLYELLTLKVPFEGASTHELIQRITRSEPAAPRSFNASIPRDLETVCLTAIEKDPKRRYASAGALAADLQRALEFRPIHARPVGRIERFARVVKRNPASSLASALAGVLVIGVPSLVALQQTRAAQNTRQVLDWALDAIAQYDPFSNQPGVAKDNEAAGPATSVAGLDRLAAKINASDSYDVATRVKVSAALGRAYRGRGFNEHSLTILTAALDLARASWGEQSVEFAEVEHELGVTLRENGDYEGATARLEGALQKRGRILGANTVEVASTLHELGWARWMYSYGRGDEALPLFQRALDLRRELLGDADVSVAESRAALAVIVKPKEVDGSGLEQQEAALRLCTEVLGKNHPRTALVRANMGQTTRTLGQLARSEQLLEQAVAVFTAKLGKEHSSTRSARRELYETYSSRGRYRSAEQTLRSVLPDMNPRPDKPYAGDPLDLWELAVLLAHENRVKEAEQLLNWAFTLPMRNALSVGEQIPAHSLAVMSEVSGDFASAASFYASGLEFSIATQGTPSRVVAGDTVCFANALRALGETDAAERVLEQALDMCAGLTARKGAGYCATAHVEALETLAAIRSEKLQYDEAAILLRECVKCRQAWPAARWEIGRAQTLLGECLAKLGCCEEAEPLAIDGFQQLSAQLVPEHEEYRRAQARLEFVRAHCAEHRSDTRGR